MKKLPLLPHRPRPLLFAHRGCSSLAPENTMEAFSLARSYGAPGLELDIHRCASGELVVIHDDSLARTTGDPRRAEELPLSELRTLDAGSWFDPSFAASRIPLLEEVLEEFLPDLYIDIELKNRSATDHSLSELLAQLLKAQFHRVKENVSISSFNPLALRSFKAHAPDIPTAIIWCSDGELPGYLHHGEGRWIARCDYLKPIHSKATAFSLALLSRIGGRPMIPWTADDPVLARTLIDSGCEGIISNKPQALVPALLENKRV